ncbi:MAG: hypothetical protein ABIW84_03950 [Ilumatobacteraceae bacterium]
MAHDQDGGPMQSAVEDDPAPATTATDELRHRMRLRLAMNASRGHVDQPGMDAAAGSPAVTNRPSSAHRPPPTSGTGSDISQMVWNSVLESLSAAAPGTAGASVASSPGASVADASPGISVGDASPWPPLHPRTAAPANDAQLLYSVPTLTPDSAAPGARAHVKPTVDTDEPVIVPAIVAATPDGAPAVAQPDPAQPAGERAGEELDPDATVMTAMIVPSIPVLAQPSRAAVPSGPATPLLGQTGSMDVAGNGRPPRKGKSTKAGTSFAARPSQKRKRRPFRAFFAFIVVAAILGGAAYAGWYSFLRNNVTWSQELEPLASFVEATLHREFSDTVAVETLPVAEYEVKLGSEVIASSYPDADGNLSALRAVGVAGAVASPSAVGHVAAAMTTAFYRPSDQVIYRIEGTTALFELDLVRSLAVALTDQQIEWSTADETLSDAQRVGLRAMVNAVAAAAVGARTAVDPSADQASRVELIGRLEAVGIETAQIPVYVMLFMASMNGGANRYPVPPAGDPLQALTIPPSDAVVFDLTRESIASPEDVALPAAGADDPRELGMQFWYAAMLPALGADAAHSAALLWAGDSSVVTTVAETACLTANVTAVSAADQPALSAALLQWAQTRPASSAAAVTDTVAVHGTSVTSVSMCEPAEGGQDVLAGAEAGLIYVAARADAEVASALLGIGLAETKVAWDCAVTAHRSGALAGYDPDAVDPAIVAVLNDALVLCSA